MTTGTPGCCSFEPANIGAGDPVGQGATRPRSGISTVFSGLMILAVSAMKWTPARTMTSASVSNASLGEGERVARDVGRQVIDVRRHVVVGGDDGVALVLEPFDLVDQGWSAATSSSGRTSEERVIWRVSSTP